MVQRFLEENNFLILESNYTKKFGEIDLIARRGKVIHFIEVKTLFPVKQVSGYEYHPFQNVSPSKMRRIRKTALWYLWENGVSRETGWVIDLAAVTVSRETRSARIDMLWNVV